MAISSSVMGGPTATAAYIHTEYTTGLRSGTLTTAWTTKYQVVHASAVVTLLPDCQSSLVIGDVLEANPDIAGLGVIVAFMLSAYIVLLWTVFAYCAGWVPADLLKAADRKCFHGLVKTNSRRVNSNSRKALERATIIFSDQQIITGIAILLAGYANIVPTSEKKGISAYHWQIITYLAWMSSNVHLLTLSLLRDWLRRNKALRLARIVGMMILLLLLLGALIPTVKEEWLLAIADHFPASWEYPGHTGLGAPVHCFWNPNGGSHSNRINIHAPFSFVLLLVSYAWKLCQLSAKGRLLMRKWLRGYLQYGVEALATAIVRSKRLSVRHRKICFRAVTLLYVPFIALAEFVDSFAATLWLLTLSLAWGSIQVLAPRSLADAYVKSKESSWTFGQLLPLLLLLQPLVAVVGQFHGESASESDTSAISTSDVQSSKPSEDGNDITIRLPPAPTLGQCNSLSDAFQRQDPEKPAIKARNETLELQIEVLYSTRCFKAVLWLIHFCILALAAVAYLLSALSIVYADSYVVFRAWDEKITYGDVVFLAGGGILNAVGFVIWLLGAMAVIVFGMSFFSRAFR